LGGFSDKIFVGEELELSQRIKKLAKKTGKQVVILHRHPLVTSARKCGFTPCASTSLSVYMIFNPYARATSREKVHLWYDGRR